MVLWLAKKLCTGRIESNVERVLLVIFSMADYSNKTLGSKYNGRHFEGILNIPAHSNGTGQMFLVDKIHGFKYTYISDENIVQQTKWYHSSIVLRKVHQFIIKKKTCATSKKPFYKTLGLQRRSIRNTINPGIRFTIWTEIKNRQG